jgi:hypothetical protein
MSKIKYPPSAIKRCDKEIKDLLRKIIDTKKGGTTKDGRKAPSRKLKRDTGDLRRNIKPIIKVRRGELVIDIEVVEYYQYLDKGTDKIKHPWFLTDELTKHATFLESIKTLTTAGIIFTMNENLRVG